MKTATLVKEIEGWSGDARLYELSEPIGAGDGESTRYVIVSAIVMPLTGPETYIFPADKDGEVKHFTELGGSYRGGVSHETALKDAGFSIREE